MMITESDMGAEKDFSHCPSASCEFLEKQDIVCVNCLYSSLGCLILGFLIGIVSHRVQKNVLNYWGLPLFYPRGRLFTEDISSQQSTHARQSLTIDKKPNLNDFDVHLKIKLAMKKMSGGNEIQVRPGSTTKFQPVFCQKWNFSTG